MFSCVGPVTKLSFLTFSEREPMEFKNNVLDIQTYDEDKIDDGLKIDDEMRPLSKIPEEVEIVITIVVV